MRRRFSIGLLVGVMLSAMVATASVVAAPAGTGCGMVITESTILTADIGPCGRGGIVIAADNISVDLGGHTISGKGKSGDGVGILFDGVSTSRVSNGTVQGFDAGVAIVGGGGHIVTRLTIRDNIGSLTSTRPAYGDGVVIVSSGGSWIFANTIVNNGPFGGVSVLGTPTAGSDTNLIDRNRIIDNDIDRAGSNETDGIRIEGPNAYGQYIKGNTVLNNGRDGIAIFDDGGTGAPNHSAFIQENFVHGNGFHGMANRKGDGIFVANEADSALVYDNEVTGNAANGIRVASVTNRVLFNDVTGNVVYPGVVGAFDLTDESPDCADNEWDANTFGSASQTCIL